MEQNFYRLVFCFLGMLLLSAHLPLSDTEGTGNYFRERANLALREIAHRILLITGDSTTVIPPVQTPDGRQFSVRFYGELRYDTLRTIIDQVLAAEELPLRYDLAVYDCLDETLLLGFAARIGEGGHPCQDRAALTRCVDLSIRFPGPDKQSAAGLVWLLAPTLLIGLLLTGWQWRQRKNREEITPAQLPVTGPRTNTLQLGQALFDPQEQTVVVGRKERKLTFREAKLLHYFAQHPNAVLPREEILEAVWGAEGVQVTRSLDVFVSRLRKIIQEESGVEIANVHGVGYRLVVRTNAAGATNGGMGWPHRILNHFRDG